MHAAERALDHPQVALRNAGDRDGFQSARDRHQFAPEPAAGGGQLDRDFAVARSGSDSDDIADPDQPGHQAGQGRCVDARHLAEIDLPLIAVARQRRHDAPHRNAELAAAERMLAEAGRQRDADAIDQVWKIFVEIEAGLPGHAIAVLLQ